MAAPGSCSGHSESEENRPASLPSYEEAHTPLHPVKLSEAAKRLYWTLDGPLTTAISVMKNAYYEPATTVEPYFSGTDWHSVSQEAMTDPPVSSMTVSNQELDDWEENWYEQHFRHARPGRKYDPQRVRFGALPDYDPDKDEDGPIHLLRCCGSDRPRNKAVRIVIEAKGDFVTVHDYVSVVHPWLIGARGLVRIK